jgi:hypothetical protein
MGHYDPDPYSCEVTPNCLECPLPACRHDDIGPYTRWKRLKDKPWILEVERELKAGIPMLEIAKRFGKDAKSIYNIKSQMLNQT